jgi:sulfur carrier protein ThiS
MTKPMVRIHNADTNTVIDREMTAAEFAQYELDQAAALNEREMQLDKATAKAALLARLGITADEAALLLL